MHWLSSFRLQSLLMAVAFLVKTCSCAKLPSSIVLIVPVNDSVVLNEGKSYVVVAYGLNETTLPLQFGYTTNTSFSLAYPNGTILSNGGSQLSPCRTDPGGWLKVFLTVDSPGIYTVTANVTYGLPAPGENCSTGLLSMSYQIEIVSAAFNVLPAKGTGSNGTQTYVTKTFASQPTGSVRSGSVSRSALCFLVYPWTTLTVLVSLILALL